MEKAMETYKTLEPITAFSLHPSWVAIAHMITFSVENRNTRESKIFSPVQPLTYIINIQVIKTKPLSVAIVDRDGYIYVYEISTQWALTLVQEFHFKPRPSLKITEFAQCHLNDSVEHLKSEEHQRVFLNDKIHHIMLKKASYVDKRLRFYDEAIIQKDFTNADLDYVLDTRLLGYKDSFILMCLNDKNTLYILENSAYHTKQYLGTETATALDFYVYTLAGDILRVFLKTDAGYMYVDFNLATKKFLSDFIQMSLGPEVLEFATLFVTYKRKALFGVFGESFFEVYDKDFVKVLENKEAKFYDAVDFRTIVKVDTLDHYLCIMMDYLLLVVDLNLFV